MFSVKQIAERLGTTKDHIIDLIKHGKLKAVNIGLGSKKPRWRISVEDLEDFKTARAATPPTPRPARRKRPADVIEFYA